MLYLIAGLTLFAAVHLLLSASSQSVNTLRASKGDGAVKGLIALGSAAGIGLIVFGWKSGTPATWYLPSNELRGFASVLIGIGVYLFIVSNRPTLVKQTLRHPQLTGVAIWSTGHLLANGDSMSVVLFGGLGLWAVVEMALINRRDGAWVKPPRAALTTDLATAVVAALIIALLAWAHPWLAGVPIVAF